MTRSEAGPPPQEQSDLAPLVCPERRLKLLAFLGTLLLLSWPAPLVQKGSEALSVFEAASPHTDLKLTSAVVLYSSFVLLGLSVLLAWRLSRSPQISDPPPGTGLLALLIPGLLLVKSGVALLLLLLPGRVSGWQDAFCGASNLFPQPFRMESVGQRLLVAAGLLLPLVLSAGAILGKRIGTRSVWALLAAHTHTGVWLLLIGYGNLTVASAPAPLLRLMMLFLLIEAGALALVVSCLGVYRAQVRAEQAFRKEMEGESPS